jgi:hypothetical protein
VEFQAAAWFAGGVETAVKPVEGFLLAGASGTLRVDRVGIGVGADASASASDNETFLAGHLGWSRASHTGRFTILIEGGRHTYYDVWRDEGPLSLSLLSSVSSTPTSLPFLGLRLARDRVGGTDDSFFFGWWVFVRGDLGRSTVSSTLSGFGDGPETNGLVVGGFFFGVGVHMGLNIGGSRPRRD